jgi:thioester reductase-like protein/acyl-coenzyme A synthetase/AMP-(fatty) acid ligase/acyl carrier protein
VKVFRECTREVNLKLIFIKGSTGKPKGVVHTHQTTRAALSTHNAVHEFSPSDKILFQSSLAFDLSVAQIWGALTAGATLLLAKKDVRKDPGSLASFMRNAGVTVTYFPATQFATLLEHNAADLRQCTKYRRAIFAGETLPVWLVRAIYDLGTSVTVHNQYGPSETSVQTSSSYVPYPGSADVAVPVGRPLAHCSHYIVDAALQPVPASVPGEVCIGGAQVSKGYLNRPDITSESFVKDVFAPDSFRAEGWVTMYKTGDKARFLSNGQLDFKGRIKGDRQTKLRGYRLDLTEVENELYAASLHLSETTTLANVAVVLRELGRGSVGDHFIDDRHLVAFLKPSRPCTTEQKQNLVDVLHRSVRLHLNDYMLPSAYQFVDDLSNLVSGKIGLQRLLTIDLDPVFPSTNSMAAQTTGTPGSGLDEILEAVISSFKVVLKLQSGREVAPTQSFFDLGGHSLLVLRLSAAIQRRFGVKIELKELFAHPTPGEISWLVAKAKGMKVGQIQSFAAVDENVNWRVEATLPDEPAFYPRDSAKKLAREDIRSILITGAERPYGLAMLARLLTTRPHISISIIGSLKVLTMEEMKALLHSSRATVTDTMLSRVHFVPGSLSLPSLGLDEADFIALANRVQVIYHFGGYVSLMKPYADLRQPNVQGTLDIIRLAALGEYKTELHYLSTWSVPHLQSWTSTQRTKSEIITTEVPPSHFVPASGQHFAYLKVRWVLEELITRAAERGIATTIFRPSALADMENPLRLLTTDARRNGALLEENYVLALIVAIARTGLIPDLGEQNKDNMDLVTAEYITATMEKLTLLHNSLRPETGPAVLHIRNPRSLKLSELPAELARMAGTKPDYKPAVIPLSDWVELLQSGKAGDGYEVLAAVFKEYHALGHAMFSLDDTQTRRKLHEIGLGTDHETLPAVDRSFLARLM